MFVMCRKGIYKPFVNYDPVVNKIRTELEEYLEKSRLQSLVIGVSGGIDSALCCALARPVCNKLGVKLIGRSLPIQSNKDGEISRATKIGEDLCHDFKEVSKLNDAVCSFIPDDFWEDNEFNRAVRLGNIKARMRMIYLYDVAHYNKGMVLSTDNLTELFLGFWTLHGDVGDYGMIQSLWKTEVYEMAEYLMKEEEIPVLLDAINATPTDGLGITDSDLDQLGARTYAEVDKILQSYLIYGENKYKDHAVIKRHLKTDFKRDNPFNIHRSDLELSHFVSLQPEERIEYRR